jgi:hypothetical protein
MPRRLRIGHARQYRVSGDVGSYAITGQGATLKRALVVTAAQGSYAVTGQANSLEVSGSFTSTGLWGDSWTYGDSSLAWRQYRRDRSTRVNTSSDTAWQNSGFAGARNAHPAYVDGRVWYGLGNLWTWNIASAVDGFYDNLSDMVLVRCLRPDEGDA